MDAWLKLLKVQKKEFSLVAIKLHDKSVLAQVQFETQAEQFFEKPFHMASVFNDEYKAHLLANSVELFTSSYKINLQIKFPLYCFLNVFHFHQKNDFPKSQIGKKKLRHRDA